MTDEQKAAYVIAHAVSAFAETSGMIAENQNRANRGEAVAYTEQAFFEIQGKYGLYYNNLMSLFHES